MSETPTLTSADPDRAELLAYLSAEYARAGFDSHDPASKVWATEEAAYYLAAHYHGGQWSNLYSVLSTSEFRPGRNAPDLTGDPDKDESFEASYLYAAASEQIEKHLAARR